jgi:hypothetical protein
VLRSKTRRAHKTWMSTKHPIDKARYSVWRESINKLFVVPNPIHGNYSLNKHWIKTFTQHWKRFPPKKTRLASRWS